MRGIVIIFIIAIFSNTMYWGCKKDDSPTGEGTGNNSPSVPAGMVLVQGGTFQMGDSNYINFDMYPQHLDTIRSFFIDKYEVTQKRWRDVVTWKQGSGKSPLNPDPSYFHGDSLPVDQVSWDDIQIWLGYLNQKEGNPTILYRLPTEAEGEYAARGGIHWTDNYTYSGSNNIDLIAWYDSNSNRTTHTVGGKNPNQLGIYDMSGNVWEWCQDWYHASYIGAPSDGSAWEVQDPQKPWRVLRGGGFVYDRVNCWVALRYAYHPSGWFWTFGFRCAAG